MRQFMKNLYLALFAFLFLTLWSCQGSQTVESQNTETTTQGTEEVSDEANQLREEDINRIIQSIPNPLEISTLIKEAGSEYRKENMNNPDFVDNYKKNYHKALNLGVYSTDLGFANIYEKSQDALNYLTSVKKLADGLTIGKFFDYNTIKKLTTNSENLDSLLQLTTSNFEKINFHLRSQNREYLSILILTGGWIEAGYLTTQVYKESNNAQLRERIGEQKLVLDQILYVLEAYKTKPNFPGLLKDLNELKSVYDRVEITEEESNSEMKIVDDEIVIQTNNKSVVKITDEDVELISSLLKSIRKKIIQGEG
jgi:hypothetical protein